SADPLRSQRRLAGYRRVMAGAGSRAHTHFVTDQRLGFADALALAKSWLVPTIRPTAIIAETEEVALAILDVASELGISVPRDLSLLSLENRASLSRSKPPISAIFHPYVRRFGEACERLIERSEAGSKAANDESQPPRSEDQSQSKGQPDKAVSYQLIERESVTKAPRAV
ncbi:MAG: substrate-binding domain-containing protein, partial [Pseudomonadota bacterium]